MTGRLPYAVAVIDGLFAAGKGAVPLRDSGLRSFVKLSADQTRKSSYGEPRGALAALTVRLGEAVAQLAPDGSNYREVLRLWMGMFMHGIMTYAPSGFVRVDVTLERYLEVFDRYERIFHQAFVAEDVSADNNYENLEFLGDGVYKNAVVFFLWRELGIQNKTIATTLKHIHENTKALSDLAKMFHMDKLARSNGSKQVDALNEDVFEGVLGVLQRVQWEIQRDPHSPEHAALTADCGFANRLVRLIFKCSDARYEYAIAPKTFITNLQDMFRDMPEKMRSTSSQTADRQVIIFKTPPSVVARMGQMFGSDTRELAKILNCTFESQDDSVTEKHFSTMVHERLIALLASPKIGITYQTFQGHKNRSIVPQEFHTRLSQLAIRAEAKGYWLALNIPPAGRKGGGRLIVHAVLYHNDPRRALRRAEVEGYGEVERERVFTELLDKAEKLIDSAREIDAKWRPGAATVGDFRMSGDTEDDDAGIHVPSHARAPIPRAPWAADAARTVVDSGTILHSAIAGNAVAHEGLASASRALTLQDMFAEYHKNKGIATLAHDLLVEANTDRSTAAGIAYEFREGPSRTMILSPDTNGLGYAVSDIRPTAAPAGAPDRRAPATRGFSVNIYGTPPAWLVALYTRLEAVINITSTQLDAASIAASLTVDAPPEFLQRYAAVIHPSGGIPPSGRSKGT
jgi:hypothetical protein